MSRIPPSRIPPYPALSVSVMGFVLFEGLSMAQGASGDDMGGKILAVYPFPQKG